MKSETFGPLVNDEQAKTYYGFIYLVEVADKKYIGKKCFTKGVNWRNYKSSNDEIKKLLTINPGKYKILAFARTNRELTFLETKYQFTMNVLEDDSFCNGNILGKFFRDRLS